MQFDGGLVPPESSPRKQREAEVKGGGIQRIGVERSGLLDEDVGEIGENAPVAVFIGVSQSAAGGGLADACVIEFGAKDARQVSMSRKLSRPVSWAKASTRKCS